jgi:hypothetical protein
MKLMTGSPNESLEERIARLWSTEGTTTYKVTTLLDGRRIDSRNHYLAWLAEVALEDLGRDHQIAFRDGRQLDSREAIEEFLHEFEVTS